ncbi:hypothetical protein pb186bvf_004970 [Paramecium bursaria]
MRHSVYLNIFRMFDFKCLDQNFVQYLQIASNIQLVQLLQLNNQTYFKYNEISQIIQFVSISGNIEISRNKWIIYLSFIFTLILIISMTHQTFKGGIGILRHIQYTILIYCSFFEFPIISTMIQFIQNYEDFQENLIICIAIINLFIYFAIWVVQLIYGKSDSIEIHHNYLPLFEAGLNFFIRFYKILVICMAYIIDNQLLSFLLLTIFQFFQYYQQFRFVSVKSLDLAQICCIQMICFIIYLNISIVWSLILLMLTYRVSTYKQRDSDFNIAYVCSQLTQLNSNLIEQYFILENHKCVKCHNISQISVCILRKLKLKNVYNGGLNLLYCDKISQEIPIKALINLTKCSNNLRIDYQIRYTLKILELVNYINKRQAINEQKDETNTLNVDQIRQSVKLYQQTIIQYIKIIKEQIYFWKRAQQGFLSYQQCLFQMRNLAKFMIENKINLKSVIEKRNLNVIELKILQIHSAVVYLSQKNIFSYQKQIDEKLISDRYTLDKNINNKVLYEGRYLLVQTSLVFNKGQLINFNQSNYNQFFNLPNDQLNQIGSIEDLMPQFKRSTHNKFLDNYIRKGYSSFDKSGLDIFICNPEGYIIMANLQLNYDNSIMDDVIVTGLIAKEQNINKAIIISTEGQILGMDQGSFDIIQSNLKAQVNISTLVVRGYFIQALIQNIQKQMDILNQNSEMLNGQLINIQDQWVSENYYNQYQETVKQFKDQEEKIDKKTILIVNQNYSKINIGTNIVYNLYFVKHYYKGGEMCYFKIMIIDQDYNIYKKYISNQSNSNSKESQRKSNQALESESHKQIKDNHISIQITQLNQNYKFFQQLLSQNQQVDNINEDHQDQGDNNKMILTPRQQDDKLILNVQDQIVDKQKINERHIEQSMTSQRSSQDSLYLAIIDNLYSNNTIVKQLVKISYILALIFIYTIIIIFVNDSLIQNSVDNQLIQIELLRKPQNITYVYTSLSIQLLFKYANQKGIVDLSPFMVYWNQVQQIYMQKYIDSLIVPLNIEVPIMANSFVKNVMVEHYFIQDQQYEIEVSLSQFYDQIVQHFCILKDDDKFEEDMSSLLNKGFLRENILMLLDLNNKLVRQINIIVTDLQQSEINVFLLFVMIELSILMVFYVIQIVWWKQIDNIMIELVLIIHRTKISQIQKQIENLQLIQQILQQNDGSWIQSPIQHIISDSEQLDSSQRKQQLISVMPQDYYINKQNLFIFISILIINILFNITGYLIYYEQNIKFQQSLSAMSNYVQFLHDSDCSFLYGALIKLDGPLNGDQTYLIDQEQIITALNITSNQLLPQLDHLQHIIYSSSIQENQIFYQLLFENLCETSSLLIMCNSSQINQEYWEKDQYNYLIQNGIIGYTNQFVKYITENYQYEFNTLSYLNIESSQQTINQPIFQNLFLQYFLDMEETLRIFLKTFHEQNTQMGQDIVAQLQGYYLGFGLFFSFFSGFAYYFWIKKNQHQIYLALQIIGIVPHSHVISQNFKSQVLKLYKNIY